MSDKSYQDVTNAIRLLVDGVGEHFNESELRRAQAEAETARWKGVAERREKVIDNYKARAERAEERVKGLEANRGEGVDPAWRERALEENKACQAAEERAAKAEAALHTANVQVRRVEADRDHWKDRAHREMNTKRTAEDRYKKAERAADALRAEVKRIAKERDEALAALRTLSLQRAVVIVLKGDA